MQAMQAFFKIAMALGKKKGKRNANPFAGRHCKSHCPFWNSPSADSSKCHPKTRSIIPPFLLLFYSWEKKQIFTASNV